MALQSDFPSQLTAPRPFTVASLAVRARALRTLDQHRAGMRRSAELVERSRALCATTAAIPEPAPGRARPPLRLVRSQAASSTGAGCARIGCHRAAIFHPRVVVCFGSRRIAVGALPLRLCAAHADELGALARTRAFLDALRARLLRRGRDAPGDVRVELEPLD